MENNSQATTELQQVEIDLKAAKAAEGTMYIVVFIGVLPLILGVLYFGMAASGTLALSPYLIGLPLIIFGLTIATLGIVGVSKRSKKTRELLQKQLQLRSSVDEKSN